MLLTLLVFIYMENTPKKERNINEQTTPKKQQMYNNDRKTVTFQVKNVGDIVGTQSTTKAERWYTC